MHAGNSLSSCLQLGTESREQMESKEAELQVLASYCRHEQTLCKLTGTMTGLVIGMRYHDSASTFVLSVWQHVCNDCITCLHQMDSSS